MRIYLDATAGGAFIRKSIETVNNYHQSSKTTTPKKSANKFSVDVVAYF